MSVNRLIVSSILFASLWVFLGGCGSGKINVHTEQAPKTRLGQLKTFGLVRLSAEQPNIERELLMMVRQHLEAEGLKYVNEQADFLVAVKFYTGKLTEYVPPSSLITRDFNPDRSGRRELDLRRAGVRRTETDRMRSEVRKTVHFFEGYVDTVMYQNIQVFFVRPIDRETVDILWHGEVDSRNNEDDLMVLAPKMIDELMKEFPPKETPVSHRPNRRQ